MNIARIILRFDRSLQEIGRGLRPRFCSLYKYLAILWMQNSDGALQTLQTLAALMFSGFLFSLSVETDPPGLNVLSHATRATDRRGAGVTFREYSKHRRDRNVADIVGRRCVYCVLNAE